MGDFNILFEIALFMANAKMKALSWLRNSRTRYAPSTGRSQPKIRREARRTGKHPAHHRKPSMSLRYARNHSR